MASAVDICNTALSHIGEDTVISSISPPDRSVAAGHCARFWPLVRKAVFSGAHSFACARKRVALAEVTNDSEEWGYKYALPSDCARARRILTNASVDYNERDGADFQVEGTNLYTDQPEAVLIYSFDQTDTTKYPADLVLAFGMVLAGYLAGPIIKGREGARVGGDLMQRGMAYVGLAAATDANAGKDTAEFTPASITARQ